MKCKFCEFENTSPSKAGKDRNGIQRYYCQNCGRQIQDPIQYQEWEKTRKRAVNKPSNKNEFDEYITCVICKILDKNNARKINGIGSSYSIAALLERSPSTIQCWIKKYKDTAVMPSKKISDEQLFGYLNSKKFGLGILEFMAPCLPYKVVFINRILLEKF